MPQRTKPVKRYYVPEGFVPTDEMEDILDSRPGSHLEANAYSCTGEEVGSVGEAHTVVVRIYEGEILLFETQMAGLPCEAPKVA
jgi:hypothetical protein